MYPISNAIKALFETEQRQVLRITGTDRNGTAIIITDSDVTMGGFNIDRYSCNAEKLEIGTAIASEMTLKLDNRDGRFNGVVFEGTELYVEIGIADWTQSDPTINWMPCGYFTSYEQPRSLNTITIHALDRMLWFDVMQPGRTPWTTQTDEIMQTGNGETIYFAAEFAFPLTVQNLIKQIALRASVPFTQSLTSFPNYNISISALPDVQQTMTLRTLIQWCAGIMGANAWIDWTGSLRFSWYNNTTGYTCTTANRYNSDLYENDLNITGVEYTNTNGVSMLLGSSDYALNMVGNYLVPSTVTTVLPAIYSRVNGFTYRPFSATVINAPYLWPMDKVTFTDKDGNNVSSIVTNVAFGLNSTTELEAKGMTHATNQGVQPDGVTKEQAQYVIEASTNTKTYIDESLTQEAIFNRLTDGGEVQGLILYDGKVYLNASYLRSGVIDGELIKVKLLQIVDEHENVIASYNDVITIGQSNQSHLEIDFNSLELYDSNGNKYLSIGELRDSSGYTTLTELFTGNGTYNYVTVRYTIISVDAVIINGVATTDYTFSGVYIRLNSIPAEGAEISVTYKTNASVYHYDLGIRQPGSTVGAYSVIANTAVASGENSFACNNSTASGRNSHAEGNVTIASGYYSHAEGNETTASAFYSHAEGTGTTASGTGSHTEGNETTASGSYSHAEGYKSIASGLSSHAEGGKLFESDPYPATASGTGSHAEGSATLADTFCSHAEGRNTTASGYYSHAEGRGTVAKAQCQHVSGAFNVEDTTEPYNSGYLEIIGNGVSRTNPSNARTLNWNGNEWIAGTLTQASDKRLKTECGEVPDLSGIRAKRFKWNENKNEHDEDDHIGYFAQDVEKLAPYLVHEDAMGYKSLDYIALLCAKIEHLERRVAELEKEAKE